MRFVGSAFGIGRLSVVPSLGESVMMKMLVGVFVGSDKSGVGIGDHIALSRIIMIARHGSGDRDGPAQLVVGERIVNRDAYFLERLKKSISEEAAISGGGTQQYDIKAAVGTPM